MTFFEPIKTLETRALEMPKMKTMLEALHKKHVALHKSVTQEVLWKPCGGRHDSEGRSAHINAAREAGFVESQFHGGNIHTEYKLTDKGREAIGAERPFWMEGAA